MTTPSEALYDLPYENRTEALRALLAQGADPNFTARGQGASAFLWIVDGVDVEGLQALLAAGADVSARARMPRGWTALHRLAAGGPTREFGPLVRTLLAAGADPCARDDDGRTPLDVAGASASIDVVRALIEHGARPSRHALLVDAVRRPEVLALLLAHGAPVEPEPNAWKSALHHAVYFDLPDAIVALLDAGAPVDWAPTDTGKTALWDAVAGGRLAIAELLLARGADPSRRTAQGDSPVALAERLANAELIALLVERARGAAARDEALAALPARLDELHRRQQALLDRMTSEGQRFELEKMGFKGEFMDYERVWWANGTWWLESASGYSGQKITKEATREQALERMLAECAHPEHGPEQRLASVEGCLV